MLSFSPGDVVLLETSRTRKHYGYALLNDDDTIFYIGRTQDPVQRLRMHVYSGSPLVRQQLQRNKIQRLRILTEAMSMQEAQQWEERAILWSVTEGCTLLNKENRKQPKGTNNARHPAFDRFMKK